MFPIYPGFEELPLRVEVEWRGRTRMVVARVERWPESENAVLVCALSDEETDGEWIVVGQHGLIPYQINPYNLVTETRTYEMKSRKPILQWKRQDQRKKQVQQVVCKAFGSNKNYSVARLLKLDDLPSEPRVALKSLSKSVWMPTYSHESWSEFEGQALPDLTESQEKARLIKLCQNKATDAHFAWKWASLNDEQRRHRLGFVGDRQELERAMSLVLAARNHDWKDKDWLIWQFSVNDETGQFYGAFNNAVQLKSQQSNLNLSLWEELIIARYASDWHHELVTQHHCVKTYTASQCYEFGYAIRNQPPTAHEQLEARLALRDWLADKAAPDVAAGLLASLWD